MLDRQAAESSWRGVIERASRAAGISPDLLSAVVWTESRFNQEARSPAGAIGLAQLMPQTAAALGVNPNDPEQNLNGAARYLAQLLERLGTERLALEAYERGPGELLRDLEREARLPYADSVLSY